MVTANNTSYQYLGNGQWQAVAGSTATQVSVNEEWIYTITTSGGIHRFHHSKAGARWEGVGLNGITGSLQDISIGPVGPNGEFTIMVTANNSSYHYLGNSQWQSVR